MIRSGEEILVDIDDTLDHLIQNASAINCISCDPLFANEIEALQKTQESLLARLVHMNHLVDDDEKQAYFRKKPEAYTTMEHKIIRFGKLNNELINQLKKDLQDTKRSNKNRPKIRNNRKRIKVPYSN